MHDEPHNTTTIGNMELSRVNCYGHQNNAPLSHSWPTLPTLVFICSIYYDNHSCLLYNLLCTGHGHCVTKGIIAMWVYRDSRIDPWVNDWMHAWEIKVRHDPKLYGYLY